MDRQKVSSLGRDRKVLRPMLRFYTEVEWTEAVEFASEDSSKRGAVGYNFSGSILGADASFGDRSSSFFSSSNRPSNSYCYCLNFSRFALMLFFILSQCSLYFALA